MAVPVGGAVGRCLQWIRTAGAMASRAGLRRAGPV